MISFDPEHPYGTITGLRRVYSDSETDTVAKGVPAITDEIPAADADWADDDRVFWKTGDKLDFICDYYSYSGEYLDSYVFGDSITYNGELEITYVYLPDMSKANAVYRFTDIYDQNYWTPVMPVTK